MKHFYFQFDLLFTKRAFVHWFVGSGIEDGVFNYARHHTAGLEKDYREIEDSHSKTKDSLEY